MIHTPALDPTTPAPCPARSVLFSVRQLSTRKPASYSHSSSVTLPRQFYRSNPERRHLQRMLRRCDLRSRTRCTRLASSPQKASREYAALGSGPSSIDSRPSSQDAHSLYLSDFSDSASRVDAHSSPWEWLCARGSRDHTGPSRLQAVSTIHSSQSQNLGNMKTQNHDHRANRRRNSCRELPLAAPGSHLHSDCVCARNRRSHEWRHAPELHLRLHSGNDGLGLRRAHHPRDVYKRQTSDRAMRTKPQAMYNHNECASSSITQ